MHHHHSDKNTFSRGFLSHNVSGFLINFLESERHQNSLCRFNTWANILMRKRMTLVKEQLSHLAIKNREKIYPHIKLGDAIWKLHSSAPRKNRVKCNVGAKEVFIISNYEVPLRSFSKNIYCNLLCEHDTKKMVGVKEVIHFQNLFKNYNFFCPLLINGIGFSIFRITFLVPSITYILAIKIGWAVFKKIGIFDFSKFIYNFCKKIFF